PVQKAQGMIKGIHLEIGESDRHLTVREMEEIIDGLKVEDAIRRDARGMLGIILDGEAKVHGTTRDELHLHELSHVDTLIDLVSVAKGVHYFGIDRVFCGPVPLGRGMIRTSHGIIPNPPPVTLEILSGYNVLFLDEPLELTTPTGAAIARYYTKNRDSVPPFNMDTIGYGVGSYATDKPDALRIFIGESGEPLSDEEVWLIEVDLDDMEMEYIGAVAERIRNEGALDVLYFPVYMKKGRLGIRLSVTAPADRVQYLVEKVFQETTTFGMRLIREQRRVLRREERSLETSFGPVRIKSGFDAGGTLIKTHIEFEDVKRISEERNIPYRQVLDAVRSEIAKK
ncbi:MAG: LarC family nickel insertion protein, partial [Syntrophorhabdaceae bacterium]|nr:LarC family nickel insertion protein [Syntrophorhabdaceae bacterium]